MFEEIRAPSLSASSSSQTVLSLPHLSAMYRLRSMLWSLPYLQFSWSGTKLITLASDVRAALETMSLCSRKPCEVLGGVVVPRKRPAS